MGCIPKAARVVVCVNFEEGTVGTCLSNRAEVPTTFEFKPMMYLGTEKSWSVGSFWHLTAFIDAELR